MRPVSRLAAKPAALKAWMQARSRFFLLPKWRKRVTSLTPAASAMWRVDACV